MNIRTLFSSGIFRLASLSVCSLLLASCVNPKEVLYIQDITDETHQNIVTKYQTTIQKDDQLYISVSSKQPELTAPFIMAEMGNSISNSSNNSRPKGYLVDDEGYIVLPVIGRMKAARNIDAAGPRIRQFGGIVHGMDAVEYRQGIRRRTEHPQETGHGPLDRTPCGGITRIRFEGSCGNSMLPQSQPLSVAPLPNLAGE